MSRKRRELAELQTIEEQMLGTQYDYLVVAHDRPIDPKRGLFRAGSREEAEHKALLAWGVADLEVVGRFPPGMGVVPTFSGRRTLRDPSTKFLHTLGLGRGKQPDSSNNKSTMLAHSRRNAPR